MFVSPDINIRYNTLKSTLESLSEKLKDSTVSRKELEADIMKVELWCREAEVKCSGELKLDCSLEALEDQKITYLVCCCCLLSCSLARKQKIFFV